MEFEWDEDKNLKNIAKHKVDFNDAIYLWESCVIEKIDQRNYGNETRYIAMGEVDGRLFVVVYTWRGAHRRIISARKANDRERKSYRQALSNAAQIQN
ncbi:MAG TPA: BrnT family toxin [Azospirillaceae bacterium]|nr:BrnT family toxin [Azospirillaceae bacterium]HRQ81604.1 BrnT family toxin [Azospirillaceae bacterium]